MIPALRPIAVVVLLMFLPLLADGQDPVPPPAAAPTPDAPSAVNSATLANNVIFETIVKLQSRERIAARIEQVVDMLNQKFVLKGNYYKDSGHRLRLQLSLEGVGGNGSKMLQVCDGKTLWEYQEVMGMKNYRKKDITPIFKKLEDPSLDETFRVLVTTTIGFGGPEALITGFQAAVGFDQFADKVVDGVPTYVLGGKWKDRSGLFGPNDRKLPDTAPLPPYIPSNIQVYIEKATLWPYRIDMIGNAPSMIEDDTREIDPITKRPIGQKRPQPKVDPTNITLRYTLLPDSEIKPDEQFVFATPRNSKDLIDETEQFILALDKAIEIKVNEKKQKEAAEGADAEAKITIPPVEAGPSSLPTPTGNAPTPQPNAPR